jgi:hypothetical protein
MKYEHRRWLPAQTISPMASKTASLRSMLAMQIGWLECLALWSNIDRDYPSSNFSSKTSRIRRIAVLVLGIARFNGEKKRTIPAIISGQQNISSHCSRRITPPSTAAFNRDAPLDCADAVHAVADLPARICFFS